MIRQCLVDLHPCRVVVFLIGFSSKKTNTHPD